MEVRLAEYHEQDQKTLLEMVTNFQVYHDSLFEMDFGDEPTDDDSVDTITDWLNKKDTIQFITANASPVGFIVYHQDWAALAIDALFVSANHRGQGIATQALRLVEKVATQDLGLEMVQLDVVPRNKLAFDFYYNNGYINLTSVNLRKAFGENPRDQSVEFNGKRLRV